MAGIMMDVTTTTTADAKAEKRARKEKKALRKAAEQEQEGHVAGPSSGIETEKKETKEERRARKEAKRLAKEAKAAAVDLQPAQPSEPEAGPSSAAAAARKEETKEERKARRQAEKEAKKATEGQSLGVTKTADVPPETESTKTKGKKRKHDAAAEEIAKSQTSPAADGAAPEAVGQSKEKKKKKQKTSEATTTSEDIFADSTLTDQAKKALHYVRQHATAHLKSGAVSEGQAWKFNKAKQNWLMRNIWSDEVPDKYVDGVVGYLKTVLGASRKSMVDTAKKYLEPSQEVLTAQAADTDADEKDNPKEEAAEGEKADGSAGEDDQLRELRRARAEKLLSALNE